MMYLQSQTLEPMKKFLEVLMDDDGMLHFGTDFSFPDSYESSRKDVDEFVSQNKDLDKRIIKSLVEEVWKNKNMHPAKAIRLLSMAEMMACAQPYEQAESFWWTMMHDYIPAQEKYSNALKKPFGFDASKMVRPIVWGPQSGKSSIMPLPPLMNIGKMKS